ncbi:hypothetical protein Zmor_023473 [Zophobas morio]|uniref:Uncharacterized protein n=1 Tax=Zophobas morio TaxID=2755281 RepID=A0AA38M7V9_9CUCU|nr:hypothetical protein Zmor_023473 [Zophobas morio]
MATKQVEYMNRKNRRNNIIITGMKIEVTKERSLREAIEIFMEKRMDVKVKIEKANKIANDMIVCEIESLPKKIEIFKSKARLKGTQIYINDLTPTQQKIHAAIRKMAKEHKEKGHKVKLGYNKLIISDGNTFIWHNEEKRLKPQKN